MSPAATGQVWISDDLAYVILDAKDEDMFVVPAVAPKMLIISSESDFLNTFFKVGGVYRFLVASWDECLC